MTENDKFLEVTDGLESEDDIKKINPNELSEAVISATDWTTETIITQINKGNIQLNPRFQRREAWGKERFVHRNRWKTTAFEYSPICCEKGRSNLLSFEIDWIKNSA